MAQNPFYKNHEWFSQAPHEKPANVFLPEKYVVRLQMNNNPRHIGFHALLRLQYLLLLNEQSDKLARDPYSPPANHAIRFGNNTFRH